MWQSSHFTTNPITLDFSSSGQGIRAATQLFADDQCIANAVELIDWTDDPIQVEVCKGCGIIHCQPGGWVSFRRCGAQILLIPGFASILRDPIEYRPPDYLVQRGILILPKGHYAQMRSLVPELPHFDAVTPLTCKEAAQTVQWQAPGGILGSSPSAPTLSASWVLAADPGESQEQVKALNTLLADVMTSESPAIVRPVNSPVTLYLDLPGTPAWAPFTMNEPPALVLAPGVAASVA